MVRTPRDSSIQRDWWSKTLAGLLLGLALALGFSALFAGLATDMPLPIRAQLTMWSVPPVWLTVLASVFFFSSGKRAWLWLGSATVLTFALALALQSL